MFDDLFTHLFPLYSAVCLYFRNSTQLLLHAHASFILFLSGKQWTEEKLKEFSHLLANRDLSSLCDLLDGIPNYLEQ